MRIARVDIGTRPWGGSAGVDPASSVADVRLVVALDQSGVALDLRIAAFHDLIRAGATHDRAAEIAAAVFPPSLTKLLGNGGHVRQWMSRLVAQPIEDACVSLADVRFLAPVDPPVYRDFTSFADHLANTWRRVGREPPSVTREMPVYYKGSVATLVGDGATVPWPHYSDWLDYELEIGLVMGGAGSNLFPNESLTHVFGVTIINDFSARDIQLREMTSRLGPAKGKDFATAVGPWVTTLDELDLGNLTMIARVNSDEWSRGNSGHAMWSCAELVAWASAGETLLPGDLLGLGSIGGGSGLELDRRLSPGDMVELDVRGIGTLHNRIGERGRTGYTPAPRCANLPNR